MSLSRLTTMLLLGAAHEDQGMFPASTVYADGRKDDRTPWQDGWNAACLDLTKRWVALCTWFRTLSASEQHLVRSLLEASAISLSLNEDVISVELNMNDTFGYACSDSQDVPLADLHTVSMMWGDFGDDGLIAYAAFIRQRDPIAPRMNAGYMKARAMLEQAGR